MVRLSLSGEGRGERFFGGTRPVGVYLQPSTALGYHLSVEEKVPHQHICKGIGKQAQVFKSATSQESITEYALTFADNAR